MYVCIRRLSMNVPEMYLHYDRRWFNIYISPVYIFKCYFHEVSAKSFGKQYFYCSPNSLNRCNSEAELRGE